MQRNNNNNNNEYVNKIIFGNEKYYKICLHLTIFYLLFVNLSVIGKYGAGTVIDRLVAFGLCRVWKACIILRW